MSRVQVLVNGIARQVAPGASLADLVAELAPSTAGVAVAVDALVVRRGDWPTSRLADGDRVEIVTAMQGG